MPESVAHVRCATLRRSAMLSRRLEQGRQNRDLPEKREKGADRRAVLVRREVSARLERQALATVPCATTATDWYARQVRPFAACHRWSWLDDRCPADARVDICCGPARASVVPAYRGVDVPAGRFVVIPDSRPRGSQVRVAVRGCCATVGQVVALANPAVRRGVGPPGVATSIGAPAECMVVRRWRHPRSVRQVGWRSPVGRAFGRGSMCTAQAGD